MKAKICLILIGWIGEGGHVEVMSTLSMVSTCFGPLVLGALFGSFALCPLLDYCSNGTGRISTGRISTGRISTGRFC